MGIHGNEKADKLAMRVAVDLRPGRHLVLCKDVFPSIRSSVKNIWQQQWNLVGLNKMKEIKKEIIPWTYTNMSRRFETALCRLRIGHTRLSHGFLMTGDQQPFCNDCLVPLTVKHVLIECPSLLEIRCRFLKEARGQDGTFSLTKVIVENFCFGIFKFLSEAGLLQRKF